MDFVHLNVKSEFSIRQSINRVSDIVDLAKENEMGAVCLNDKSSMMGVVEFYSSAKAKGIKPLVGLDAIIENEEGEYSLNFIAKSHHGYKKMTELLSKGFLNNRKDDYPVLKEEWLYDLEDVIVIATKDHLIGKKIAEDNFNAAIEHAKQLKTIFKNDLFIGLERDGLPQEDLYVEKLLDICEKLNIPPVATHPVNFKEPDDFVAHETRYCIGSKEKFLDISREKHFNKEMCFKSKQDMIDLFYDIPEAIENTVKIAQKCNLSLSLGKPELPNFPTPNGISVDEFFAIQAREGLEEKLEIIFPDEKERKAKRKEYDDRLETEIKIIQGMKFPGYFLIVSDFINWAKNNDIPVGPGRGSGAGSLVAYSLKITDLDPLPYGLLFERFLNPERVSMPDFDIDFCQARRDEVIQYVKDKYGSEAVSQIATYGTMAAKAVVRDVGRALGYSYDFVDEIAKAIYIKPGANTTLHQFIFGDSEKGIEADEKLKKKYEDDLQVKKLIDIALKLEGITKSVGTHAGGVVIAPTKLTDFSPLYTLNKEAAATTQFAKDDVEKVGLVKFDFLGLKTLTEIHETVKLIQEKNPHFKLDEIDLNDMSVYTNIFFNGNSANVFQFESNGMISIMKKAKPTSISDLTAINALYRPGPMDIIPEWLDSKNTPEERRPYPHPKLRDLLKETYGFMVYQEQVMQAAQIIAGYSLGGADLLRRAMGKKKPEEMAKQRQTFIEGAGKNGVDEATAIELFNKIDKFSGYGFNKSHAAAYSFLAYQTAYLKHHYPEEFFIAKFNGNIDEKTKNTDKISLTIVDAEKNKINVLPPDINESLTKFSSNQKGAIRYGLAALKGIGMKAAELIVQEREKNGPFSDLFNFLERVSLTKGALNKRVLEALIKGGVLDVFEDRQKLLDEKNMDALLSYVKDFSSVKKNTNKALSAIADDEEVVVVNRKNTKTKEVNRPELIEPARQDGLFLLKKEKEVFGFFYSDNPFEKYFCQQLDGLEAATRMSAIKEEMERGFETFFTAGVIEEVKPFKSKKGAFVDVNDGTCVASFRVYEEFYNANKDWLKPDAFIAIRGKASVEEDDDNKLTFSYLNAFSFNKTKEMLTERIYIGAPNQNDVLDKVFQIISPYETKDKRDSVLVSVLKENSETGRRKDKVADVWVKYNENMLSELSELLGEDWVKLKFKKDVNTIEFPEVKGKRQPRKKSSFSV